MKPLMILLVAAAVCGSLACSEAAVVKPPVAPEAAATPAAERQTEDGSKIEMLVVDSRRVTCVGEGTQQCLRVKRGAEDWTMFYEAIDGFSFEEGYTYKLKVRVSPVNDPPADGSSLAYSLVEVVEKKKVD
jgi:hypothetical protein